VGGCDVATCDAAYLHGLALRFDRCQITGGYYKKKSPPAPAIMASERPAAFSAVCDIQSKKPCAIKTCANGQCQIKLFDGKAFVPVDTVQDVDKVIDRADAEIRRKH
jgi:hypothetical protein